MSEKEEYNVKCPYCEYEWTYRPKQKPSLWPSCPRCRYRVHLKKNIIDPASETGSSESGNVPEKKTGDSSD